MRAIVEAAERVLSENPAATLEQIAEAAGVSRATVHRRFANRDDLIRTMGIAAWQQIRDAITAARPRSAPPLVALHQATANIIEIKHSARYALDHVDFTDPELVRVQDEVFADCDLAFTRARADGHITPDTDLSWAR
ncbi:TetR/AcrR family transcriptional regulator, partial [Nocardia sp. NPDC003963]